MRRIAAASALVSLVALLTPISGRAATVTRAPVSFQVSNPLNLDESLTVSGGLFRSDGDAACAASVMLLIHGLSYGEYAWDFPVQPETYSVARALALKGYPVVAVDLPGYGASSKPNGYSLTVQAYASIVGQITDALRSGGYGGPAFGRVGLMGHSAGTEITELAIGLGLADADIYIPTGYTHVPSQRIAVDFFTGDYLRAAQDDYEYFGGTEQGRTEYMYSPLPSDQVDPAIVAADHARAGLTPSGEVYSIGPQPSKLVMWNITVPTLLILAEMDLLFPIEHAATELALFLGTPDKTLHVVPDAGHSFMLHRNAPDTMNVVTAWLADRGTALPAC